MQTVDFITPVVDDPFEFGAIAAANAFSDIYAMGGTPLSALNLLTHPGKPVTHAILSRILQGGRETADQAGVLVVGGHSVKSPELMYGMAVTGLIHPQRIVTNAGARPGDRLILTKPVGVGIITTALKNEAVDEATLQRAVDSMRTLNKEAARVMTQFPVHACTDVTGFGLLGHLWEMTEASGVSVRLELKAVPYFPEAVELAEKGHMAGGLKSNQAYLEAHVQLLCRDHRERLPLLYDPQTSGGLLMAVAPEAADGLLSALHQHGVRHAALIGEFLQDTPSRILIV